MNEFFVSTTGDDTNNGSIEAPFKTLEATRNAIRQLEDKSNGVVVNIRGGVYNFDTSFVLDAQDGGISESNPIIYKGYQNEKVTFTGGKNIPTNSFTNVTDPTILARLDDSIKNSVLVTDLQSLGITNYGEIFKSGYNWDALPKPPIFAVDGESQIIARWPNNNDFALAGTIKRQGFIPRNHEPDKDTDNCNHPPREEWVNQEGPIFQVEIDDAKGALWQQEADPWFYGYWVWDWAFDTFSVVPNGITKEGNKWFIEADSPSRYGAKSGKRYYAFNMLCELDSPGEWYLDRTSGKLYFMPPAEGIEGKNILLATFNQSYFNLNSADNIIIENISFANSVGDGITIKDSNNVKVAACSFSDIAGKAVEINGGTNCGVQSSNITRMGAGGITLIGGDRISLTPGNHYANNNDISNYAMTVRTYTPAIQLTGVGNRATNNLIYDAPHMAIQFSGNDLLIENNEIFNVCYETDDAAAIYAMRDWTQRGNVINNNYLHDIYGSGGGHGVAGVYLDDCYSGVTITNNLFRNVTGRVLLLGGGRDNVFKHNIIMNDGFGTGMHLDDRGMGWGHVQTTGPKGSIYTLFRNIYDELQKPENSANKEKWIQTYPAFVQANPSPNDPNVILDQNNEEMGQPTGNEFTGNILVGLSKEHSVTSAGMNRGTYVDNHNLALGTDIGFTNPYISDFTFADKSKVTDLASDFKGIDITKVALYTDAYRAVEKTVVGDVILTSPVNDVTGIDIYNVTLDWKPATNAKVYSVMVATDESFNNVIRTLSTQETSISVVGLEPETGYFWKVVAADGLANGGSNVSIINNFTTAPKAFNMNFGFEDVSELGAWTIQAGNPQISSTQKNSGASSLLIGSQENKEVISKELGSEEYGTVDMWFFDGMSGTGAASAVVGNVGLNNSWAAIGTNGTIDNNYYVVRIGNDWIKTEIERTNAWHKLTWDYTSGKECIMSIDDAVVGTFETSNGFDKVELGDMWGNDTAQNAYYFDDVSINLLKPNLEPTNVMISNTTIEILQGESFQLLAYVTPATANQNIVWSTNENNIATVTQDGLVTGDKGTGTATITATSSNPAVYATCTVVVKSAGKNE